MRSLPEPLAAPLPAQRADSVTCAGCGVALAAVGSPCARCGAVAATVKSGHGASLESAPEADVLQPGLLEGKWRLEKKLGEGGMGTVYLAHDVQLDRKVAVKLMSPTLLHDAELVARFEREARVTAALEHPHIVPVYAVGRAGGRPFMVMKNLAGRTLQGLLRERGSLPLGEVLALMRQLCAGLDFIHARGFIHRDIKSANLFVGDDGHVTILDFGIQRSSRAGESVTLAGTVIGTPQYMSPEQAMGLSSVDSRADLYALAVVLFECLAGSLPFDGMGDLAVIHQQAHTPPPDLCARAPRVPRAVADVVRRALSKAPEARYPTAGDLFRALAGAAQGTPTPSLSGELSIPLVTPAPTPLRRAARGAAGVGLALACAVGLALASRASTPAAAPSAVAPAPVAEPKAHAAQTSNAAPTPVAAPTSDAARAPNAVLASSAAAPASATSEAGPGPIAPPAPAPPQEGTLNVVTTHKGSLSWASLQVDGTPSGTTPAVLKLPVGEHRIVIQRAGFRREERRVRVAAEAATPLRIELKR